jgi:hypothetical protein
LEAYHHLKNIFAHCTTKYTAVQRENGKFPVKEPVGKTAEKIVA